MNILQKSIVSFQLYQHFLLRTKRSCTHNRKLILQIFKLDFDLEDEGSKRCCIKRFAYFFT